MRLIVYCISYIVGFGSTASLLVGLGVVGGNLLGLGFAAWIHLVAAIEIGLCAIVNPTKQLPNESPIIRFIVTGLFAGRLCSSITYFLGGNVKAQQYSLPYFSFILPLGLTCLTLPFCGFLIAMYRRPAINAG